MNKSLTALTSDSQKLLIETVKLLEKIISANDVASQEGVSKREGPLFFPGGIGNISVTVRAGGAEVIFTVSGQYTPKQSALKDTD